MSSFSEDEYLSGESRTLSVNVSKIAINLTIEANEMGSPDHAHNISMLSDDASLTLILIFSNNYDDLLKIGNKQSIINLHNFYERFNTQSNSHGDSIIPRVIFVTENFLKEIGAKKLSDILDYVSSLPDIAILIKSSSNIFHSRVLAKIHKSLAIKRLEIPAKNCNEVEYTLHIPELFHSKKDYSPYKYIKDLEIICAAMGSLYRDVTVMPDDNYYVLCSFNFFSQLDNGLYFPIKSVWENPETFNVEDNIINADFPLLKGFSLYNVPESHVKALEKLGAEITDEEKIFSKDLQAKDFEFALKLACLTRDTSVVMRLFSKNAIYAFHNGKSSLTRDLVKNKLINLASLKLGEPASMKKYPILFLGDGEIGIELISYIVANSHENLSIFSKRVSSILSSYEFSIPRLDNMYLPLLRLTSHNIKIILSLFKKFCEKNEVIELRLPIMTETERHLFTKIFTSIDCKVADEDYQNFELFASKRIFIIHSAFFDALIEALLPASRANLAMIAENPIFLDASASLDISFFIP